MFAGKVTSTCQFKSIASTSGPQRKLNEFLHMGASIGCRYIILLYKGSEK